MDYMDYLLNQIRINTIIEMNTPVKYVSNFALSLSFFFSALLAYE